MDQQFCLLFKDGDIIWQNIYTMETKLISGWKNNIAPKCKRSISVITQCFHISDELCIFIIWIC